MKIVILTIVLKIFYISKYSTQSIPNKNLDSPLLLDHYPTPFETGDLAQGIVYFHKRYRRRVRITDLTQQFSLWKINRCLEGEEAQALRA